MKSLIPVEMQSKINHDYERHIVLVSPDVHWNTGNIGRTCIATGSSLHLIKPLGFSIDSRQVKRAGLDYWHKVHLSVWETFDDFEMAMKPLRSEISVYTKSGKKNFRTMTPASRMFLVFGSETAGISKDISDRYADRLFYIPITGDVRSLNLSTSAGIALYESLRSVDAPFHGWGSEPL
jgi:tRNA (cytidine/uridine-2'-O-)-methyltransferase